MLSIGTSTRHCNNKGYFHPTMITKHSFQHHDPNFSREMKNVETFFTQCKSNIYQLIAKEIKSYPELKRMTYTQPNQWSSLDMSKIKSAGHFTREVVMFLNKMQSERFVKHFFGACFHYINNSLGMPDTATEAFSIMQDTVRGVEFETVDYEWDTDGTEDEKEMSNDKYLQIALAGMEKVAKDSWHGTPPPCPHKMLSNGFCSTCKNIIKGNIHGKRSSQETLLHGYKSMVDTVNAKKLGDITMNTTMESVDKSENVKDNEMDVDLDVAGNGGGAAKKKRMETNREIGTRSTFSNK